MESRSIRLIRRPVWNQPPEGLNRPRKQAGGEVLTLTLDELHD